MKAALQAVSRWMGLLGLCGCWLSLVGCASVPHTTARQQAADRWSAVRAQVKARLAADRLEDGQVEAASTEMAEAARLDPNNTDLRLLSARIDVANGRSEDAQQALEKLLDQPQHRGEAEYLLSTLAQQRGDPDAAREHALKALEADPSKIAYLLAAVQALQQQGQVQEALDLLASCETQHGWTRAYRAALAECYEQRGEWLAASAAWRRVLGGSTEDGLVRERLGLALHKAERFDEAEPLLRETLEAGASPNPVVLRRALAESLLALGRPAAAREVVAPLLRVSPDDAAALRLVAMALAAEESYESALSSARHALRAQPDDVPTLELAAALALRTGRPVLARQLAERLQRVSPGAPSPVAEHILAADTLPAGAVDAARLLTE